MKIKELFKELECEKIDLNEDIEISSIAVNDYECKDGSIFFCLKRNEEERMKYVKKAISFGAVVIISNKIVNNCAVAQIVVENPRALLSIAKNTE